MASSALSGFTRTLVEKRGHADQRELASFIAAGFRQEQLLEVIAGLAVSTLANYAGNITHPTLEAPFRDQRWEGE